MKPSSPNTRTPEHLNTRMQGHGRTFPEWLDVRDPEARKGTRYLRAVDANLTVGWNRRNHQFEVWGPSLDARGWVALAVCQEDDGTVWRGSAPWERMVAALIRARDGELSADRAARENEARSAAVEARSRERAADGAAFYARAVESEASGSGRWSAEDVGEAYRRRTDGTKAKAPGRVVSLPGKGEEE